MYGSRRVEEWIDENQHKALSRAWTHQMYFSRLRHEEQKAADDFYARCCRHSGGSPVRFKSAFAAGTLEHKAIRLRMKAGTGGPDKLTLYGAVWNNIDRQGDVIEPGAVKNCSDFEQDGVILVNHVQADLPVASPVLCDNDTKGMKIVARWHTTPAAQECRQIVQERIAMGKTVAASIGYTVLSEHYENRSGKTVRVLSAINVFEVSLVNLPANPLARVISA